MAAELGLRERSVAGVRSWYPKGRYSRKQGVPRAQRSKRYCAKATNLSKRKVRLRKMVLREGAIQEMLRRVYVGDPNARRQCIDKHGPVCFKCSFKKRYGAMAEGFIHVHHVRMLSSFGKEHKDIPIEDLRPVCPNCHAVLHMGNPVFSIEKVPALLRR
jgi:predicted HNH restriction endonuclease